MNICDVHAALARMSLNGGRPGDLQAVADYVGELLIVARAARQTMLVAVIDGPSRDARTRAVWVAERLARLDNPIKPA